ncbi:ficolin-1-like [Asterias amurensis]|uniref:ficolin-1-like n=1 Tax=Asterias amurensis TaxID=7602 RepID=UPI003AB821A0
MAPLIRALFVVLIVKSQTELQVESATNQRTISSDSKVDMLKTVLTNYLTMVNVELRKTNDHVKELEFSVNDNQETVSTDLDDTKRQMGVMERKVEELQESVSALTKLLNGYLLFQRVGLPTDCSDILAMGVTVSGVYTVKPTDSGKPFRVFCDMETDGGGWTVFQRRQDGSVDFYLDFASYSRGFGNLEGEFWLGNDYLHRLTAQGEYELRVDLSDFSQESTYAAYDSFSIADMSENYRLALGVHTGTARDSLAIHNNQDFTTKDRDNDAFRSTNCAVQYHGAWWYKSCFEANLNGRYVDEAAYGQGIIWSGFSGNHSLKNTEMKIRSKD